MSARSVPLAPADPALERRSEPGALSRDGERRDAFAKRAWRVLAYTVAVVLFGAVVRITGSGAGCGQHWPTCQGEVVHVPKTMATAIELSHRLTSGLSLVFVIGLLVAAFRVFPAGHVTRRMAASAVVLMITESLVGAALVLLRLVEHDTSVARAVVMSIHLVNTSFLAGAIALTAWSATRSAPRRLLPKRPLEWTLVGAIGIALLVSVTGAVTALGDTLYPVATTRGVAARIAADQVATASFLEHGRVVHPAIAALGALFLLGAAWRASETRPDGEVASAARRVMALVFAQVAAGVTNVLLAAPGWMQVVHLGIATTLWLSLVVLYATVLTDATRGGGRDTESETARPTCREPR